MNRNLSRSLGAAVLTAALATSVVLLPGAAPTTAAVATEPEPRFRVVGEPTTGPTTAQAGPRRQAAAPGDPSVSANRRQITSEVVSRRGSLYLRGDVESDSERRVYVVRRSCSTCRWRLHDVVWTAKGGAFRSRIFASRRGSTYWRAKVAPSNGYARSYSSTWETYY